MHNVVISCVVLDTMQHVRIEIAGGTASVTMPGSVDEQSIPAWLGPIDALGPALLRLAQRSQVAADAFAFAFDNDAS